MSRIQAGVISMLAYGILAVLTLLTFAICSGVKELGQKRHAYTVTTFFVGYIILLCGRDVSVGVDTLNYLSAFNLAACLGWNDIPSVIAYEPGFLYFCKIVSFFGDFRLLIVTAAIVSVAPLLVLYRRKSEDALLCCSFFLISLLFEMFFSGMRQGLAIGLGVCSFYFVERKHPLLFVLTVLFACSFHSSALVLFALYPLYYANITRKWLLVVVPAMVALFFLRGEVFPLLIELAGDDYAYKYSGLNGESGQLGLMLLFILLSIYSLMMLDEGEADQQTIGFRNILLFATMIQMFAPLNPVVSRLNYYFILFIPLAIACVNNRCHDRFLFVGQAAKVVLPVYFVAYFFFAKSDSLGVFDYSFFM